MRALVYASLFVAAVLLFVPARILALSGIARPYAIGGVEVAGLTLGTLGAVIALWCVLAFAVMGKGTPAPFDPPRRLVVRGPYRFVRNPMYIGAGLAVGGAALFYRSAVLLAYVALLWVIVHQFVRLYEEPTLKRLFGQEYDDYCRAVYRWWPRLSR